MKDFKKLFPKRSKERIFLWIVKAKNVRKESLQNQIKLTGFVKTLFYHQSPKNI